MTFVLGSRIGADRWSRTALTLTARDNTSEIEFNIHRADNVQFTEFIARTLDPSFAYKRPFLEPLSVSNNSLRNSCTLKVGG